MGLVNLLFAIILILGFGFFTINIRKIIRNINLATKLFEFKKSEAEFELPLVVENELYVELYPELLIYNLYILSK